ncbi:DHH family phosphoesterase [Gordonia sp. ABSL1-1]|uniref:DHH family phosphoesterase n=1 Tax=Gordonia sp. ABSL1-1 TaxID=3053923 RepID=UPI0025722FA6|nr:DHH family phosphoesterase [Gordonia sp. ABSL1-1]MDL9936304.1 DHH family phosphoesterase [Gordonia sp. ABSL1-1]
MNATTPASVADVLAASRAVTILCHVRPDADTIGSGLALGLALDRRGVDVEVAFPGDDRLPGTLGMLPGAKLLVHESAVVGHTTVVAVDAATIDRLDRLSAVFERADRTVVIDHHASNEGFGQLDLIDAEADCTATLVLDVLDAMDTPIDADIATCIYAGLVTDTGSFKWARPDSLRVAARLLDLGVDGRTWSRLLLDSHPLTWLTLVAEVLGAAQYVPDACDGGLVYAVVPNAALRKVDWAEVESVIDILRTAQEAEVAAVCKEIAPGSWAVSLRAKESVDLVPVARSHGGGGHRRAAGYSDTGTVDEVVTRLLGSF